MKKPSFLERLIGASPAIDYDRVLNDEDPYPHTRETSEEYEEKDTWEDDSIEAHAPQEGELPVDMYQTHDAIVIRALVAGVSPTDMEISITRDMVTIRGMREEIQESADDNYYHRELFWGGFTRTLLLPEEIVIDEAEASEKHGLLEIRLPKLDKNRSTQLRVKTTVQK
jgi:HSP20 family protein